MRDGVPGEGQGEPAAQGDRHGAAGAAARGRARELRVLPRPAGGRPRGASSPTSRARSSCEPLFEYSGACAGCGETPYIKLLTQLFGDRAAHRQRDRLLVDLRRQPADDAVHGEPRRARARRGRTRCSRTTPSSASACGSPSISTSQRGARAARSAARTAAVAADAGRRAARRGPGDRGRHPRRSARASPTLQATRWPAHRRPRRPTRLARARGLPRRRRACGSSAATAGPTTSATAASTTCWRSGARRQHPRARHRGLLEHRRPAVEGDADRRGREVRRRPARRRGKKDLGLMAMAYGHVYVAQVAFGAKDAQTVKAFQRSRGVPGTVAHHRLQPLHRARLRHGARPRAAEAGGRDRATGRSTASTRGAPRRRDRRSCSTRPPPKGDVGEAHGERDAVPADRAAGSRALPRRWSTRAQQHDAASGYALYEAAGRAGQGATVMMDLSTTLSRAARCRTRSCRAPRRWSTTSTRVRRLEDAGAAAIVMHSLFEEQIAPTSARPRAAHGGARRSRPPRRRRTSRRPTTSRSGPTGTWSRCAASSDASSVPVIGSLNGTTAEGWLRVRAADRARPAPTRSS